MFFCWYGIHAQNFEMFKGDTINKTDASGQKSGRWIIFDDTKTIVLEEGKYILNKKEGIWKKYYDSGKIKHELTYKSNKPDGYAKFYYENGIVSEEGLWKNNKWVGEYKFYFENGNVSYEWKYNEQGKRSGEQKYYHPNGKVMIVGDWQEGKESGIIKEFDENGNLVSEKNFSNGTLDQNSIKNYDVADKKNENNQIKNEVKDPVTNDVKTNNVQNNTSDKLTLFNGTGYNKLYTKDGKIEQEGDFVNGILQLGKKYYYDASGKLAKTVIIKDGKVYNVIYETPK
jgi:antitoxin component YwqK of YwqJK toxin-antitoxin module